MYTVYTVFGLLKPPGEEEKERERENLDSGIDLLREITAGIAE
jgi:hypothetical protein